MPSDLSPAVVLQCDDMFDELAAGDDVVLSTDARVHVAQCLRCQAELAGFRRLRRSMRGIADRPVPRSPTLELDILTMLDEHDGRLGRRVPGYAAATIGGLAAAAGVIALAARQRRGTRLVG
jgi:anti-sigma factor RsiW